MKFDVDALEFREDESVDFEEQFDLGVGAQGVELSDIVNGTTGFLPQDVGTDLVGGKFAQTVDEGKALADDGETYDTIQRAVNNASSWVKVGPGRFRGGLDINTDGIVIEGSGNRTVLNGSIDAIESANTILSSFKVIENDTSAGAVVSLGESNTAVNLSVHGPQIGDGLGIEATGPNCVINNCLIRDMGNGMRTNDDGRGAIFLNNTVINCDAGSYIRNDDCIIANCYVRDNIRWGLYLNATDNCILYANRLDNGEQHGLRVGGSSTDNIVAKNRISNYSDGLEDTGSGTVLSANLVTPEDEE